MFNALNHPFHDLIMRTVTQEKRIDTSLQCKPVPKGSFYLFEEKIPSPGVRMQSSSAMPVR